MPFLFIHGVNVRDQKATINSAQVLAQELADHVVGPLATAKVGRLAEIGLAPAPMMFVPFWGDVGVKFRWNLRTVPQVGLTNVLGGGAVALGQPLPGQAEALSELLADAKAGPAESNPLLLAARYDLKRFLNVVFAPTVFLGEPLVEGQADAIPPHPDPQALGPRGEAVLVDVLHDLAADPEAKAAIDTAGDDPKLLERLQALLLQRLEDRVESELAPAPEPGGGQAMGGKGGRAHAWLSDVKDRVGEFFGRVGNAPERIATVTTLTFKRQSWNEELTRFTGDAFEYLHRRGDPVRPGKIVEAVLQKIAAGEKAHPGEPWFVVTHSMGGNIFYDILTHYKPDMDVEVWLSVGGQVGLFEEMKLFHASDVGTELPVKVTPPGAKVRCWLNIYDPADPFAFLAKPVFATVAADVAYSTGAGGSSSHSAYFKQRSFYDLVRARLEAGYKAMPKPATATKPGSPTP